MILFCKVNVVCVLQLKLVILILETFLYGFELIGTLKFVAYHDYKYIE